MSPKVSVLIPVYNAEKYVEQCLASLSAQTFGDFEIICLDDGSRDSSAKLLRAVMRREPRLRLTQQANAGVAAARQSAVVQGCVLLAVEIVVWDGKIMRPPERIFLDENFSVEEMMQILAK